MKNFRSLWQPNFVCLRGRRRYSQCLEANQEKFSTESSTGIFAAASSNTVLENICFLGYLWVYRVLRVKDISNNTIQKQVDHYEDCNNVNLKWVHAETDIKLRSLLVLQSIWADDWLNNIPSNIKFWPRY